MTEPSITLWVTDEPLAYQTATGGRMSFKIYNHVNVSQEGFVTPDDITTTVSYNSTASFTGPNWNASWNSFIWITSYSSPDSGELDLYPPGGGEISYTNFDGTYPEYSSNNRMVVLTNSGGSITQATVLHSSGAKDIYGLPSASYAGLLIMTQQIDPQGHTTTFVYNTTNYLIQSIVDCDGKTNTFSYTWNPHAGASNLISSITNRYGHYVSFAYDTNHSECYLTNVVDAQGLSTVFGYDYIDDYGILTNMVTPYGTNAFDCGTFQSAYDGTIDIGYHYCVVTEPDDGQQLFAYVSGKGFPYLPKVYTDTSNVPTNRPPGSSLDNPDWNNPGATNEMNWGNSFYWNREQFQNLSPAFTNSANTNNGLWYCDNLSSNDYANGRLRHWNHDASGGIIQDYSLSMERLPSPDGVTTGKMTWWDYPNKPYLNDQGSNYNMQGSSVYPSLVIRVQPDGTEWYQMYQTDQWGNRTNVISTYSSGGAVLLRTNSYVYSTNTVDLLQAIAPDRVSTNSYGYNTNHQVLFMTGE